MHHLREIGLRNIRLRFRRPGLVGRAVAPECVMAADPRYGFWVLLTRLSFRCEAIAGMKSASRSPHGSASLPSRSASSLATMSAPIMSSRPAANSDSPFPRRSPSSAWTTLKIFAARAIRRFPVFVPNAARIGFEAAKALDLMMSGGRPGFREMLIPPSEVVVRQSTDNGSAPNNLVDLPFVSFAKTHAAARCRRGARPAQGFPAPRSNAPFEKQSAIRRKRSFAAPASRR